MRKKTTFVSFLLDETGSMSSIKDDTIGGFNSYVETLKNDGDDILFSLVSFNSSKTKRRYVAEPIQGVPPLTEDDYVPNAMTPLIDAAVKIIKATDEAVQARDDDPNVVIVMQTDGAENVSVEYTTADLAAEVKEKEAAGWQFVFLGAGMDAFAAAREAGMVLDAQQVMSYGRKQSREAFAAAADNLSAYAKSGRTTSLHFSDTQRADSGDEHSQRYIDGGAGKGSPSNKSEAARPQKPVKKARPESTADDYTL